jgi:hypothetical protein
VPVYKKNILLINNTTYTHLPFGYMYLINARAGGHRSRFNGVLSSMLILKGNFDTARKSFKEKIDLYGIIGLFGFGGFKMGHAGEGSLKPGRQHPGGPAPLCRPETVSGEPVSMAGQAGKAVTNVR